jgi:hypothetical protein
MGDNNDSWFDTNGLETCDEKALDAAHVGAPAGYVVAGAADIAAAFAEAEVPPAALATLMHAQEAGAIGAAVGGPLAAITEYGACEAGAAIDSGVHSLFSEPHASPGEPSFEPPAPSFDMGSNSDAGFREDHIDTSEGPNHADTPPADVPYADSSSSPAESHDNVGSSSSDSGFSSSATGDS